MKRCLFLIYVIFAVVLTGCHRPSDGQVAISEPTLLIQPVMHQYTIGKSVQNRPIEYCVLGAGGDVVFLMGAIHGNEPAGTKLLWQLLDYLMQNKQLLNRRTVVILPAANPDGLAKNMKLNANGVDLNRNFATLNRINNRKNGFTALSEPETRAIVQIISQYKPDRIITIHQPLNCIDYDGPAEELARRMAQTSELPLNKLGARPGSLGSYAGLTLGIPIITLELPKNAEKLSPQSQWRRFGKMLIAAISF